MENRSTALNAVVCGFTPVCSLFLKVLSTLDKIFDVRGYWNPSRETSSLAWHLKSIDGSFQELTISPVYDVLFLCFSPQIQHKLLSEFLTQQRGVPSNQATPRLPIIILVPPSSTRFDVPLLSDSNNSVVVAMPFRKLTTASLMIYHLKHISDRTSGDAFQVCPSLPLHWTLGAVQSFHARLSVINPIHPNNYSWLCESGIIGGGLVNLYGTGLIDLAFHLTGGLRIASLTCLRRTFDSQVSSRPSTIRRINAEDYVLICAELESRTLDPCKPVAMICMSADLPQPVDNSPSNDFSLTVELTGSSGRFFIPPSGDTICWNRVDTVLSTSKVTSTAPYTTCSLNGATDRPPLNSHSVDVGERLANGDSSDAIFNAPINLQSSQTKLLKLNGQASDIRLERNGAEEVAIFSSESPVCDPVKKGKQSGPSLLNEAWSRWLTHLATSLHGSNSKQSLELLTASPEHWGYIQRVVKAIEKSARMRSWIDVATGERI